MKSFSKLVTGCIQMFQTIKYKSPSFILSASFLFTSFLLQTGCGGGESDEGASGIENNPIAYIKRATPRDDQGDIETNDVRVPVSFTPGGELYLKTRSTPDSPEINITDRLTNGAGDVQGLSVSFDGKKLLFSMRLEDPDPNDDLTPSWNIYEYDIESDTLTQLTALSNPNPTDDLFEDDISPHYLPSGDIIFSSNRQVESKGIRGNEYSNDFTATDENRNNRAFLLHVRSQDDGSIRQVSFNQSHDLDPTILQDSGLVLFSRWNHMGGRNDVSLYTMTPDGTDVKMYYGSHSHNTGQDPNARAYTKAREMDDGRLLAILRPFVTSFGGGDTIVIDAKNFADNTQPTWEQQGAVSGTAQTVLTDNVVDSLGISLKGYYNAIAPMLDGSGRYLMSWTQCQILSDPADQNSDILPCSLATSAQLTDPNVTLAPPSYGIFLVNPSTQTQLPLVRSESDTLITDIAVAYPRNTPPIVNASSDLDSSLANVGIGVLHIRSVYDFDSSFGTYNNVAFPAELDPADDTDLDYKSADDTVINLPLEVANPKNTTADERPARFIRITKGASIPPRDVKNLANTAYGVSRQQGMREIIGYAPIEPDGSVKIKVPADVPLTLSILDKDGRRMGGRHQSWFTVRPGETLECIGCHVHDTNDQASNKPHGRISQEYSLNQGAPSFPYVFRNSVASLFAEFEETMAEARTRSDDNVMQPSIDLIYDDVWTDDVAANRSVDASFVIDYSGVNYLASSPAKSACDDGMGNPNTYDNTLNSFTYCRIVINYVEHIQPIWEENRTYLDQTSTLVTNNCTTCHNLANVTETYGQLELTNNASDLVGEHMTSYQELFRNDIERNADGTEMEIMVLQDILVNGQTIDLDMDGNPDQQLVTIPDPDAATITPSMSTAGARSSRKFMELMTGQDIDGNMGNQPTDTKNHHLMLTPSELKLITEWLDIGAQYYNNPVHVNAPVN